MFDHERVGARAAQQANGGGHRRAQARGEGDDPAPGQRRGAQDGEGEHPRARPRPPQPLVQGARLGQDDAHRGAGRPQGAHRLHELEVGAVEVGGRVGDENPLAAHDAKAPVRRPLGRSRRGPEAASSRHSAS